MARSPAGRHLARPRIWLTPSMTVTSSWSACTARRVRGSPLKATARRIDRIQTIVARENISCDFKRLDGYLFVPPGDSSDVLDKELAAAHRAGLTDVERVARARLEDFDTGPCLRFPRQAQFH